MTDLEELIEAANRLCESLSAVAKTEAAQIDEICHDLEMMSWQSFRIANDLKVIKEQFSYV